MCWYIHFNKSRLWYSDDFPPLAASSFVVLWWPGLPTVVVASGGMHAQCSVQSQVRLVILLFASLKTWWLFAIISEWLSCFRSLPHWSLWRLTASEQFLGSRGAPARVSCVKEDPGATCSFAHFFLRVLLESVSTAGEH